MMKLSYKINLILLLVFALFTALGFLFNYQYNKTLNDKRIAQLVDGHITSFQADFSEIVSNILLDQKEALALYLGKVAIRDGLTRVEFLSEAEFKEQIGRHVCEKANNNLICHTGSGSQHLLYFSLKYGNTAFGVLKKQFTVRNEGLFSSKEMSKLTLMITVLFVVVFLALSLILRRIVEKPVQEICDTIQPLRLGKFDIKLPAQKTRELKQLADGIASVARELQRYEQELTHNTRLAAVGHIAHQVAHDIRSPLTALKVVTGHLAEVPEERRVMIRNAVQRIEDIANDLVMKKVGGVGPLSNVDSTGIRKGSDPESLSAGQGVSAQLLSSLIEPLVSEKRNQHRSRLGVEIRSTLDAESYGVFACVEPVEFKRVLSNLVNNSVEALGNEGEVTISLAQGDGAIRIIVVDNGKGVSPETLPKLTQQGATFGKENGSGLGLYHARTTVEGWGGSLDLESTVGKGTAVTITIPRTEPPSWFVPELKLTPDMTIVVIDDDSSIHQVWDGRFVSLCLDRHNIRVEHFTSGTEVCRWYAVHPDVQATYLCDYELLGDLGNGLDLIEKLGIQRQSILVTSRYEEPEVQGRCSRLGVQLMPKGLAGYVPIRITPRADVPDVSTSKVASPDTPTHRHIERSGSSATGYRVLVIDDDECIRMAWGLQCKRLGIGELKTYASMEECEAAGLDYRHVDIAFVDKNIPGSPWRVDRVVAHLKSAGVAKVFVASGEAAQDLKADPLCAGADGIVPGKVPDRTYFDA